MYFQSEWLHDDQITFNRERQKIDLKRDVANLKYSNNILRERINEKSEIINELELLDSTK